MVIEKEIFMKLESMYYPHIKTELLHAKHTVLEPKGTRKKKGGPQISNSKGQWWYKVMYTKHRVCYPYLLFPIKTLVISYSSSKQKYVYLPRFLVSRVSKTLSLEDVSKTSPDLYGLLADWTQVQGGPVLFPRSLIASESTAQFSLRILSTFHRMNSVYRTGLKCRPSNFNLHLLNIKQC